MDVARLQRLPKTEVLGELVEELGKGAIDLKAALAVADQLGLGQADRMSLAFVRVGAAYGAPPVASDGPRAPSAAVTLRARGRVVPRPDRPYTVAVRHGERSAEVEVTFTAAFARHLRRRGLEVDLETGELVDARGRPEPWSVHRAREAFRGLTGRSAPGWLVEGPAGLPEWPARLTVDFADGGLSMRVQPGTTPFRCFREAPEGPSWPPASLEPVALRGGHRGRVGEIALVAGGRDDLARAEVLVREILGPSLAAQPERRAELELERRALAGHLVGVRSGSPDAIAAAVPPLRALAHAMGAEGDLGPDELIAFGRARLAELGAALAPIQVVVVPRGKHYSSLPEVEHLRDELRAGGLANGATVLTEDPKTGQLVRYAFLPAESLAGDQATARHELYHVLEDVFLSAEARAEIDRLHARTLARGGPFARDYGVARDEFFTTMAEEFEGTRGRDGPAWLRANHPELYARFVAATGRDPVGGD